MKKILLSLIIGGTLLGAASTGLAMSNPAGTYYMPLEVGVFSPEPTLNFTKAAYVSIGAGYNLNQYFAVQANLAGSSSSDSNNATKSMYLVDAEAKASLPTQTNIMPYALLGVGAMHLVSTNPMMDGGVGLAYALGPNLSANATYRLAYQFGQGNTNSIYSLGLSWNFGQSQNLGNSNNGGLTAQQQSMLNNSQQGLKGVLPGGVSVCKNGQMSPNQAGCVTFNGNVMTMHLNVKFAQNMSTIRPTYYGPISRLGDFMKAYPNTDAVLYGYASSEGPLAFNQTLSTDRANVVKNYLVNVKHISASRLTAKGMGISNPIASNATESGRALNRRVEADIPVPMQVTQ